MVGYMHLSFADLVFVGERIEIGLRKEMFDYVASTNSGNRKPVTSGGKKKEGETHDMTAVPTWTNFPLAPYNPLY